MVAAICGRSDKTSKPVCAHWQIWCVFGIIYKNTVWSRIKQFETAFYYRNFELNFPLSLCNAFYWILFIAIRIKSNAEKEYMPFIFTEFLLIVADDNIRPSLSLSAFYLSLFLYLSFLLFIFPHFPYLSVFVFFFFSVLLILFFFLLFFLSCALPPFLSISTSLFLFFSLFLFLSSSIYFYLYFFFPLFLS